VSFFKGLTNKYKKDAENVTGSSLLQIVFLILAFLLSAFAANSLSFNPKRILDDPVGFSIRTGTNLAIMMITFKVVKFITAKKSKVTKMDDKGNAIYTPYQKTAIKYKSMVEFVNQNKLKKTVIAGVDRELNQRMIDASNGILASITNDFTYNDIFTVTKDADGNDIKKIITDEEIEQHCKEYQLKKKETKQLKAAIVCIINGKVPYDSFTANDILIDSELKEHTKNGNRQMKLNVVSYEINEMIWKTLTSLISTAVLNSLIWNGMSPEFWIDLLKQSVLILSSVMNGIFAANTYLACRKHVLDNRISLLSDCDIDFPSEDKKN
jgi:hypothetical protein